jgi:hypothetical protein
MAGALMNPEGIHATPRTYSVWVGDIEVNDYLLSWSDAHTLAAGYIDEGYDDVQITGRDER